MSKDSGPAVSPAVQVIIVDDNYDAAMSLTLLLELENVSSATAGDAETALQMVEQVAPPVFLIDIGLPGINGFELAKRLRASPGTRNATLIALTGREIRAGDESSRELFDQFWNKPFDPNKLLAEVKASLAAKR